MTVGLMAEISRIAEKYVYALIPRCFLLFEFMFSFSVCLMTLLFSKTEASYRAVRS